VTNSGLRSSPERRFDALDLGTDDFGGSAVLRLRVRRFVSRFESIQADMAAELALDSSGIMTRCVVTADD
jgi:hypothetical protein